MAGSTLIRYAKFGQDASRLATWSVTSGTEDPEYPATKLNGYDPTDPAKLTSTSGTWKADLSAYPAYSTLVGVALIHTNLQPGLEVHLEGSTSPTFVSIGFDTLIVIPALFHNWPVNPITRFVGQDFPYWRVRIAGTNPVAISVGHIALLTGDQTLVGAQQGITWADTIPVWDDETEIDVPMDLDLLTQLRACTIDTYNINGAQAAIDDWWFDARGKILPFVVMPNVNVNECYYMTFAEKTKTVTYRYETPGGSIRTLPIKLKEFGRGMRPTPWLV